MIVQIAILVLSQMSGSVKCDTSLSDSGKMESCSVINDSTGRLESQSNTLNGLPEGKQLAWYSSGKLMCEYHYKHNKFVDTSKCYTETGEIGNVFACSPDGDSCTITNYFDDGAIRGVSHTKNGENSGRRWSKYPNRKWLEIHELDELGLAHGLNANWDSLGQTIDSVIYFHGRILRGWWWYPDTRQIDHRWSNDSNDLAAIYLQAQIKLMCILFSKVGCDSMNGTTPKAPRVREAAWFGPDGKSWGQVVNGNGAIRFYEEGKLDGTETYKAGVLVKTTRKYLDDGSLNPLYKKKGKR